MNLFGKIYKYKVLILFSPIWINFIFNLFFNVDFLELDLKQIFLKLLTITLLSIAFYLIGSSIKNVFNIVHFIFHILM